jgi:serine/threonine-protein kinase
MDDVVPGVSASASDPVRVGEIVAGRYELRRVLGRGAAAVVFAAEHTLVKRPVALKLPLIDPDLHELLCARLRREIAALAHIRHPNVVDAIDAGETDGMPFLAMELLEGRTLSGLIAARGKLHPHETIKVGIELAEGLGAVHAAGFMHRDVKPSNVLVTSAPLHQVHLCDFGIARGAGTIPAFERRLTEVGCILGTPEYMSREAMSGTDEADHRVDVYALGITLFECLTGNVPVEGTLTQILIRLASGPMPSVASLRSDVPTPLAAVISRCMNNVVSERYQTMAEVAAALRALDHLAPEKIDLLRVAQPQAATFAPPGAAAPRPMPAPEARRGHTRAPYLTVAALQRDNGATTTGRTEDISEGGVLLISEEPYTAGEVLRLRFALPMSGRVLSVKVNVRWVRKARGAPATGLEFIELPDAPRAEIQRYVALMSQPRAR